MHKYYYDEVYRFPVHLNFKEFDYNVVEERKAMLIKNRVIPLKTYSIYNRNFIMRKDIQRFVRRLNIINEVLPKLLLDKEIQKEINKVKIYDTNKKNRII